VLIDVIAKQKEDSLKDWSFEKVKLSWIEWLLGLQLPPREIVDKAMSKAIQVPFNANRFVRDVKNLVSDEGIMQCLFVASEGVEIQDLTDDEPRLRLFLAKELSIDKAQNFLKNYYKLDNLAIEHLRKIRRTFSNLDRYSDALDKNQFVAKQFAKQIRKVKALHPKQFELLKKAASHPVDSDDYENITGFTQEDLKSMVARNLLYMNDAGSYEIQFEAIALAVREVKK